MNTVLNINRLGLLLKRFFIENRQSELTFWGIAVFVFTLFNLSGSMSKMVSVEIFMFISGLIFAARTFKVLDNTASGMHYLLIPATQLEKLTTAIVLSTFYFFAMTMVAYVVGTVFGVSIGNVLFELNNPIHFPLFTAYPEMVIGGQAVQATGISLWSTFLSFATVQSIFMLGSITFKGNAVGKTMLTIILFFISMGIFEIFLLKSMMGTYHLNGTMVNLSMSADETMFESWHTVAQVVRVLLIPFFWTVAYYRLTEKEV